MKARWVIVALALLAATAFVMSVQGGRWWSIETVEIGPFGSKQCFGGECRPAGLGWIRATERWARTGTGVWAGGLISGLLLLVVAAGVASGRVPRLAARTALVAITTAALAAIAFVAQFPGVDGASVDRGLWLFVVGTIAGAAAAVGVLRAR